MIDKELEKLLIEFYFGYAMREALGGGKGHYVMCQLEGENPELAKLLREVAKNELIKPNQKGS